MTENVEAKLEKHVEKCIQECKGFKYTPSEFMRMRSEYGTVETIRRLIHKSQPSEGFKRLWLEKRLDLTMEAVIFENKEYHDLFTSEIIEIAKNRLKEYKYEFKT